MKILVINSGSSSIKTTLFDAGKNFKTLAENDIKEIGSKSCKVKNHVEGLKLILDILLKNKTIKSLEDIKAVGHRVVHGGDKYIKPTIINNSVIKDIREMFPLAPLHNPANLEGILACRKLLKGVPQVAVFDTSFHQTMPEKAFLYALPINFYLKNKIRRYGFHGTSHKYIVTECLKLLKKKKAKIISCHLGNGSSITASVDGKSVDTSMGFTPLEGIMMGTRCGSIDPAIIFHMNEYLKIPTKKIYEILNKESGLKGISGISSDMKIIYEKSLKKNKSAIKTIDMLSYQLAKFIGAYTAAMNGVDAIVFTGGLGENAFYVREKALANFDFLGIKLDKKNNRECNKIISSKNSKVKVFVTHTDEEKIIAQETEKLLK